MLKPARLPEIAGAFLKLGCISFGGPVAHLGYFREEFVAKRRWLDDNTYADLVALCQFLPGPTSSQVVFSLGMQQAGLPGALAASVGFIAPSALLMIIFAYGVSALGDLQQSGWLHGLRLAAVAVVAQAVCGMGKKLCPDPARVVLALLAAGAVLLVATPLGQIGSIAAGAIAGCCLYRRAVPPTIATHPGLGRRHLRAAGALGLFLALLVLLPVLAAASGRKDFQIADSFYRAGALVFGGGHVVLPLLRAEVVPPGWITDDSFLAGYGAAQALPGPLFTFAAFLGTLIAGGPQAWLGGIGCLFAIFLPGWLLVGGALPFWHTLRGPGWAQAGLRGANAAVVGVLLAALYHPLWQEGVANAGDFAAVGAAFSLLEFSSVPPWAVVALLAVTGKFLG